MLTPTEKLKELKDKFGKFSRKNDERIAAKKMYEQRLLEEFDCESIDEGEEHRNSLIKKKKKLDSKIELELKELEEDMIKSGIIEEND